MLAILALSAVAVLGGGIVGTAIRGGAEAPAASQPLQTVAPRSSADLSPLPGVAEATAEPSGDHEPGWGPSFSDGFRLQAQPCAELPTGTDCDSSGATTTADVLWILVTFENGTADDVLAATVVTLADDPVGGWSVALAVLGCTDRCDGWTFFELSGLEPGQYRVHVNRHGEPAGTTGFAVER